MNLGILCTIVREDEKLLFAALEKARIRYSVLQDRQMSLDLHAPVVPYDLVLQRSMSFSRGLATIQLLEIWGIPTVNSAQMTSICGNKMLTTAVLARAKVPQPKAFVAYTVESALSAIELLGYPVVLKSIYGSWGLLIAKINDREAAEAVLEHRHNLGSAEQNIFYLQEYIRKPGRDIRAFVVGEEVVCTTYRESSHWITNNARGGVSTPCTLTTELSEIALAAASAVGGGIMAIDILETPDGALVVNEINPGLEFVDSVLATGIDIPGSIVSYLEKAYRQR